MIEFVTESGSHYVIDDKKNIISGGQLLCPVPFVKYNHVEVGERALIYFEDEVLHTSFIKEIIS